MESPPLGYFAPRTAPSPASTRRSAAIKIAFRRPPDCVNAPDCEQSVRLKLAGFSYFFNRIIRSINDVQTVCHLGFFRRQSCVSAAARSPLCACWRARLSSVSLWRVHIHMASVQPPKCLLVVFKSFLYSMLADTLHRMAEMYLCMRKMARLCDTRYQILFERSAAFSFVSPIYMQ